VVVQESSGDQAVAGRAVHAAYTGAHAGGNQFFQGKEAKAIEESRAKAAVVKEGQGRNGNVLQAVKFY